MTASIFDCQDYKTAIREVLKAQKAKTAGINFKKISEHIGIQYTYLSKVMNDTSTHLNEDDLFAVLEYLDAKPEEIDYVLLLRTWELARSSKRKRLLAKKIDSIRTKYALHAEQKEYGEIEGTAEMEFILDPLATIVYVALHIQKFREQPFYLCTSLGISEERLKEILIHFFKLGLVVQGKKPYSVASVKRNPIHYSKNHPLIRTHQQMLKSLGSAQLLKLSETEKHGFMVTFSANKESFEKIHLAFLNFLKEVESIAKTSSSENVYQFNFELFPWLK